MRTALRHDLDHYLRTRAKVEHISAISLSVSLHGDPTNIDVAVGNTRDGGGTPLTASDPWQIGSNAKAFTAAAILQLEAEGKLTIDQTLGRWLPPYPAWKHVTIQRLLNMTSGIPGYDGVPTMLAAYAKNPQRHFTLRQLVAYVDPTRKGAPSPTTGYSYSNTNYVLAEMIIERATGHSYASEIQRRFLRSSLRLGDTYYAASRYPIAVQLI